MQPSHTAAPWSVMKSLILCAISMSSASRLQGLGGGRILFFFLGKSAALISLVFPKLSAAKSSKALCSADERGSLFGGLGGRIPKMRNTVLPPRYVPGLLDKRNLR